MKSSHLGFCLCLAGSAFAIPVARTGNPALHVSAIDGDRTTIELENADITQVDSAIGFLAGKVFQLAGEFNLTEDGKPALPHITRFVQIPEMGSVALQLLNDEFDLVQNVDALPFVENDLTVSRDEAIYSQDAWYPLLPAVISDPMIFRDFRVVVVTLYPVQVNPVSREARLYRNLQIKIVPSELPGANELHCPRQISGSFAPIYRNLIPNLDPATLDDATTIPGSYLILARDHATPRPWADSLANWLRLKGYSVVIDERPNWTVATMRAAIETAYATWDPPLEYVTLLGDPQAPFGMPTDQTLYDHAFALGNPGDDFEDIAVGRISCSTSAEFATAWRKLMLYEREPDLQDSTWTTRALLWATLNGTGRQNDNVTQWSRDQFLRYTAIDSFIIGTGMPDNNTVRSTLGGGCGIFLWMGGWGAQMPSGFPGSLESTTRLPIVFLVNEWTGQFATNQGLTEQFLIAGTAEQPKGGVCAIGTVGELHAPRTNTLGGAFVYSLCNEGVTGVGQMLLASKYHFAHVHGFDDSWSAYTIRGTNLMGEPSMSIWTGRPREFRVEFPDTVSLGSSTVAVRVTGAGTEEPVGDALVVLWKQNEIHARLRSDAQGFAILPVSILSTGAMQLAVTMQNYAPFLATIQCSPAQAAELTSASFWLDDTENGNGDCLLNPGELLDAHIYLRNISTAIARDISVIPSTANPHVTIITELLTYPDIAPGDSALAAVPLHFALSEEANYADCVQLRLAIILGTDTVVSAIPIFVHAGSPVYLSHNVLGGDGDTFLEPGETAALRMTIRNSGDVPLWGLTGELFSRNQFVTVSISHAVFGDVQPEMSATNDGWLCELSAHHLAYRGTTAHFWLVVGDQLGLVDTLAFAMILGNRLTTDPTGPDAYGYYAYENIDTAFGLAYTFNWVDITQGGTNLNINDPGIAPLGSDFSLVRTLPFAFTFYGEEYSQITICSNGWAAFGDHSGQDQAINYPIPGQQAPDAFLAPFWDDLQTFGAGDLGVWDYYDAANQRYLIQWNARTTGTVADQTFQVILFDPVFYPTRTGDGTVVFQYHTVFDVPGHNEDIPYCTIGIQAPGNLVGLQYSYMNGLAPGATFLAGGRTITFTTETRAVYGEIEGRVFNTLTDEPIPGAMITVVGNPDTATSDATGHYEFPALLIGVHSLFARATGYMDTIISEVVVFIESTTSLNIGMDPVVSAEITPQIPLRFKLAQNFPNPFNSHSEIEFTLPTSARTTLKLYNLLGEDVRTLIDGGMNSGVHRVSLDAEELTSGIYFYRLSSGSFTDTRKLILLK